MCNLYNFRRSSLLPLPKLLFVRLHHGQLALSCLYREQIERCVYEPLEAINGSVSAEHGVGLEKKPYLHLCRSETELTLMRTLKQALDPKGLLNPGKIFDLAS